MMTPKELYIYCDGGARGNPGPAAIGVVIKNSEGKTVHEFAKKIGVATNNTAEYTAVKNALEHVVSQKMEKPQIVVHVDSQLIARQLSGIYKVKQPHLRQFVQDIKLLEMKLGTAITYKAIPREENTRADFLVNQALDSKV